jgi:hypothetical protein
MDTADDKLRDGERSTRRPYETPQIEETGTFERLVLSCAREPIVDLACDAQLPVRS